MTLDNNRKKLLEKILGSPEFSHSKIHQTYLSYLVEAAEQGRELKETTIAMEVFGKDATFNPAEDTTVRSHTYTLRKKLENYYLQEGKTEKIRLKIPKGHYEVLFTPVSADRLAPGNLARLLVRNGHWVLVALLAGLCVFQAVRNRTIHSQLARYRVLKPDDPFWKEYLKSELPILLVVGDHFFFNDSLPKYGGTVSIRHPRVNSAEDLRALYPGIPADLSAEPYFPYHSIWSLPPILSMLFCANQKPILRKSSDVSPQNLDEYNILFLGSIKTLYALKHTLLKSHFRFEIAPHRVVYTPPGADSSVVFKTSLHSPGPNEDLVLACKLPGPDGNTIFIIASYHSLGVPEISATLTTPSRRANLEKKFMEKAGRIPPYFEILFRVTGIDKTAYNIETLVLNEIAP
ncbi:MAG: hypothetical protein QUS35_02570 [bacterium]|nr:hypothetical protein [bacterium]